MTSQNMSVNPVEKAIVQCNWGKAAKVFSIAFFVMLLLSVLRVFAMRV